MRILKSSCSLALLGLLVSGCVQGPSRQAWRYLQRSSVRVAILPAGNRVTNVPGAQIIVDKTWEETLRRAGFQVVNADSVVTYASSGNGKISDLPNVPTAKLGQDLKVDFILENRIVDWSTKYQVIQSVTTVSCESELIEARTGATIWRWDWTLRDNGGNNGNNGLAGMLVNAAVTAIANSMFDAPTRLAKQGIAAAGSTQPYPGYAPATSSMR